MPRKPPRPPARVPRGLPVAVALLAAVLAGGYLGFRGRIASTPGGPVAQVVPAAPVIEIPVAAAVASPSPSEVPTGEVSDVLRAPRPRGGEYFGLYILGKKVGYQYVNISLVPGTKDRIQLV